MTPVIRRMHEICALNFALGIFPEFLRSFRGFLSYRCVWKNFVLRAFDAHQLAHEQHMKRKIIHPAEEKIHIHGLS